MRDQNGSQAFGGVKREDQRKTTTAEDASRVARPSVAATQLAKVASVAPSQQVVARIQATQAIGKDHQGQVRAQHVEAFWSSVAISVVANHGTC